MLASHNLITPSDHAPIDKKAGSNRSGLLPKMMQMGTGGTGRGPESTHFPRQVQCIVKLCLPISATHTPAPGWKGWNLEKSPTSHYQGSQEPKHFSAVKCQYPKNILCPSQHDLKMFKAETLMTNGENHSGAGD